MRGGSHGGRSSGGSSGRSGSHFGGSSSGGIRIGGSHHSHHHGYHGHHHGHGPVFIFRGGDGIHLGIRSLLCIILIFFSLMFLAFSGIGLASAKSYAKSIEQDYNYYQSLISTAEGYEKAGHKGYIVDATIIAIVENKDVGKWYIKYSIPTVFSGKNNVNTTFSIYSEEDIKKYSVGGKIKVALEEKEVWPDTTDSINYDYKDYTLEQDGEYVQALADIKSKNTMFVISIFVLAGAIALLVFSVIKEKKKKEDVSSTSSGSSSLPKNTYCKYCGSLIGGENKCENCGASQTKIE